MRKLLTNFVNNVYNHSYLVEFCQTYDDKIQDFNEKVAAIKYIKDEIEKIVIKQYEVEGQYNPDVLDKKSFEDLLCCQKVLQEWFEDCDIYFRKEIKHYRKSTYYDAMKTGSPTLVLDQQQYFSYKIAENNLRHIENCLKKGHLHIFEYPFLNLQMETCLENIAFTWLGLIKHLKTITNYGIR